jgi:hypothetical protein
MPFSVGSLPIDKASDLACDSFSAAFTPNCRWHNELQQSTISDQLAWVRGLNQWGKDEGETIFGTDERASNLSHLFLSSKSNTESCRRVLGAVRNAEEPAAGALGGAGQRSDPLPGRRWRGQVPLLDQSGRASARVHTRAQQRKDLQLLQS